jgi:tetratricopeptide (TPR) repeat protein
MAGGRNDGTAEGPDERRDPVEQLKQALLLLSSEPGSVRAVEALTPLLDSAEPRLAALAGYLAGLTHMRAGDKSKAIEFLARAVHAGELNAAYPLGALLADAGRLDEAARAMQAAATLPQTARAANVFLARLAMNGHDTDAAIDATRAALQPHPRAGDGPAAATEGDGSPEEVMEVDPQHWFQLAVAFDEAGQPALSADCFEECAKTADPRLAEAASGQARRLRATLPGGSGMAHASGATTPTALLNAVDSGSTSVEQAVREIEMLPDDAVLTVRDVEQWLTHASARVQAGRWLEGFAIARTVRALASRPRGEWADRYTIGLRFMYFAADALRSLPHPHLYALAMEVAQEILNLASSHSDDERKRLGLYLRSRVHTGPYISLQSLNDIDIGQRFWQESLVQQLGAPQAEALRVKYGDLPPIERALEMAERDLVTATGARDARFSTAIEASLSEVLHWRLRLAPASEQSELRSRCEHHTRRALTSLEMDKAPATVARLLNTLAACGAEPDAGIVNSLLALSLDEWRKRLGPTEVVSLIQQLANILLQTDPPRGLSLLREARSLLSSAPESVRLSCWLKELLLIAALAGARYPFEESLISDVDLGADARLRGAQMIAAAFALSALSRPQEARRMVDRFEQVAPVLADLHAPAIQYMRTVIAEMVFLAETERNPRESARQAVAMLDFYTRYRLPDHAANVMYQLGLLASAPAAIPVILEGLRVHGLRTASFLGGRGTQQLTQIHNRALATMYNEPQKSPEVWLNLIQQIGGVRFSTALASGVSYRVPPGGEPILNQIRQLAQANPDTAGGSAAEEELLTAYVSDEAELEGGDTSERLANLRHRFDWMANQDLGERAAEHSGDRLYLDEVGPSVGGSTAVLHLLPLPKPDGSTIIIGTCLTSAGITIDGHERVFPGAATGGRSPLSALGSHVRELRRLLQQPGDGPLPVSVGAAVILEEDLDRLLPKACHLALRRAREEGQDHLLIVPHGPLHYYPLHLLGPASSPLCDSWKVSYVPTLAALGPRRAPNIFDAGRSPMAAIGLGFTSRRDVDVKLPGAVSQAREIAALFGCEPLAEADANKGRVMAAMRTSRRVHLATHGHNSVTAPAFQSMLVTPSATGGDSEIAAWELGELDLRGVEIVTTAACETGLGRFDELDNLRGLPASLFLAGVQSMATTLWPVGVDSSQTFFITFYSHLKNGESRIDAFAAAQRETRSRSPEYRRWAGYTLSGSWT